MSIWLEKLFQNGNPVYNLPDELFPFVLRGEIIDSVNRGRFRIRFEQSPKIILSFSHCKAQMNGELIAFKKN